MNLASLKAGELHVLTKRYLGLPKHYSETLGEVRWSFTEPGLAGLTDAWGHFRVSNEHLAQFIEGFASQRTLITFGQIVHWACMLQFRVVEEKGLHRLRDAFNGSGCSWRNAGALAGALSAGLADAANPPAAHLVCARLRDQEVPTQLFVGVLNPLGGHGEEPAVSAEQFERHILQHLHAYSSDDLRSWLTTGRGPVHTAGKNLAEVPLPPRTQGDWLDELWDLPRLAGAKTYLAQMVSALTLPPRRLAPQELPLGGYADIITRGAVDQLLPSQHALDSIDFLRRFAEHELLFFRREDPATPHRYQLVVLLDQGVRAWGDVRLVLTAAVVALARKAHSRKMDFRFACTSIPGDILNAACGLAHSAPQMPAHTKQFVEELGKRLEASDCSFHPGVALESLLEKSEPLPRDILLLTHPGNLREPQVQAAARRLTKDDRLFALALDPHGDAELCQLRHGLPVRLRQFHVDFNPATTITAASPVPASSWTGDVEPIGWPFVFGVDADIAHYDFDFEGEYLVAVTKTGMLFAWGLNDKSMAVLPRPMIDGQFLATWVAMVGVAGGFVLAGPLAGNCIFAHFQWGQQRCKVHKFPWQRIRTDTVRLLYNREYHCVVLADPADTPVVALDLANGEFFSTNQEQPSYPPTNISMHHPSSPLATSASEPIANRKVRRVEKAFGHFLNFMNWDRVIQPQTVERQSQLRYVYLFDPYKGIGSGLHLLGPTKWGVISPERDGKKVFPKSFMNQVQLAQDTLAVAYSPLGERGSWLSFFHGPEGSFLRDWLLPPFAQSGPVPFLLSPSGTMAASRYSRNRLEVQATHHAQRILLTQQGGFGTQSRLWVGNAGMLLSCGRNGHSWLLLQWRNGILDWCTENNNNDPFKERSRPSAADKGFSARVLAYVGRPNVMEATQARESPLKDDPQRWKKWVQSGRALFALDRFGQVAVFDLVNRDRSEAGTNAAPRLVFQLFAHGDSWSAWMPDGTRHGVGMVHHWPSTPDAILRMGQALQALAP